MIPATHDKTLIIERYEDLRSFALEHQQKHVHLQNEHVRFIRKGMSSWIVENEIKMPIESKFNSPFVNVDQKNDFQSDYEPQIMQTIADILFKKIKRDKCYC